MLSPYEQIQEHIANQSIQLIEDDIELPLNGLYLRVRERKAKIVIQRQLSQTSKRCVCAEELGHHYTSTRNLLSVCAREYERQEYRAHQWAHLHLAPLDSIGEAYVMFDACKYSMAEWLNVTIAFLDEAIAGYADMYGIYHHTQHYSYKFEPYFLVKKI